MGKKVAIIVPGGVGGGQFNQGIPALVNLISGLGNEFDITVFSMVSVSEKFKPGNFKIKSIRAEHNQWTLLRMVKIARLILKAHKEKNFDLFHGIWGTSCGTLAVLLGKWLDCPSLVSLQGGEAASIKSIGYGHLRSGIKKRWLFRTLYAADQVTALTHFQVNELNKHGFRNKETQVIPYGVDTDIFLPKEKGYEEPIQFIHIANLTAVKDQATLLKAFKTIRGEMDCQLKIIGGDYCNGKIQDLCRQLGVENDVSFLGAIPNKEIPGQLAKSHILLHTSLYEAQAVVIVEAMAAKVLVAGTRVGILDDLNEYMVTVPVGDYQKLATEVIKVVKEPKIMNEKIEWAYKWAYNYTIDYTIQKFSVIYQSLSQY